MPHINPRGVYPVYLLCGARIIRGEENEFMKKTLIIANWKCNPTTLIEAKQLFNSVKRGLRNIKDKNVEIVICPPFIYIAAISLNGPLNFKLAGQDSFWEENGAFTGEISSTMLRNMGCQYVILGHSERRKYFKETDEMINRKVKSVILARLNPIFCIGENWDERKENLTQKVLRAQVEKGLKGIAKKEIKKVIIAYEPVWAIGTGKACSPEEAEKSGNFIRKIISRLYNQKIAKNIKILYGGSVNSQNAAGYIFGAKLQGLLVGGASLDASEFTRIIKNFN